MPHYEFRLPDIGEGLAEAEVAKWLVSVGDRVAEDQAVVEMMTDKASVELPAPGAGGVVEQRATEGDLVKIEAVLYVIDTDAQVGVAQAAHEPSGAKSPATVGTAPPEAGGVLAPPAVRKLARELGVDLGQVKGTGPGGRISAEDVQGHVAGAARPRAVAAEPGGNRLRLRGVQKRMAETMTLSARTIHHVTGFHELDAAELSKLVASIGLSYQASGMRVSYDSLI